MNVFLSWSGERSRLVANAAKRWLTDNFHTAQPWMSTDDIRRGEQWMPAINQQLGTTSQGIVFLTKENQERPWILFEAGALLKGLAQNRVWTFLIDLQPADIQGPLSQFNHTLATMDDLLLLLRSINENMGDSRREEASLLRTHEHFTPGFLEQIQTALSHTEELGDKPPQTDSEVLREILALQRATANRLADVEMRLQSMDQGHQVGLGQLSNQWRRAVMAAALLRTEGGLGSDGTKGDTPGGSASPGIGL